MISAAGMLLLFYADGAYVTQEVSEDLTPPPLQYRELQSLLSFKSIDLLLVGVAANSCASLEVFFFFLVSIRAE